MVALGRPEAGEQLLADCGFVEVRRQEIPFVAEFADPETYARAISSVGPAYEAIENVGEDEFVRVGDRRRPATSSGRASAARPDRRGWLHRPQAVNTAAVQRRRVSDPVVPR